MIKKLLWTLPILLVGMIAGGFIFQSAFASSSAQVSVQTYPYQMMQQQPATHSMMQQLNTPQGQAMVQACSHFMSQFGQAQK